MSVENINGVAAASVETVNGVAAASVETISGVTGNMATFNSKGAITELHQGYRPIVTYDEDTDRLVCVYQDSTNNRLAYVMASLADDGAITAYSDNDIDTASCKPLAIEYNKRINKVILCYIDDDADDTYCISGTVTGGTTNTISWGSRDKLSSAKFENANATYETVHNGGEVHFTRVSSTDTSSEKFDFYWHEDTSGICGRSAGVDEVSMLPSKSFSNDNTGSGPNGYPEHVGITFANMHGGTNGENVIMHVGCDGPPITGKLQAWAPHADGHVNAGDGPDVDTDYGNNASLVQDDDTENYHVAWDETIGKGIVVAQSHASSNDSKPYYWQFTYNDSDHAITVNTDAAIDSGSATGYGINCMYDHDAGAIVAAWQHKTSDSPYNLDLRFKAAVVNSSDNNVAWGTSLTLYDGTGGAGQSGNNSGVIPPTTNSPDRVDMCYTSGSRKGIVIAFSREKSGTGHSYLISMSGQGTTDYSNTV